jgi:FixJ family two-component response regulator
MPEGLIISVVDDDADARDGLAELLRSLGYIADSFSSAEHFLNSGRVEATACLIADIHMPGRSGFELHKQLLADGHRTPVIFISAFSPEEFRARAAKARAVGFLSKPLHEESLVECLKLALAGRMS